MPTDCFSGWMRIDLHIHTDKSKMTKADDYRGKFSVSKLKDKLAENQVRIFSLTDHNIVNVDAYKEYYETCNTDDPLLLLGMELDIVVQMLDGKSKDYHSLLIFNTSGIDKVLNVSDRLEKAYSTKGIVNKKDRKLSIADIAAIFPADDFFFIPHAASSKNIISPYKDRIKTAQTMLLLMQSAFEKVPQKAIYTYNQGFNAVLNDSFKDRNDLAYIDFSDNHNIEKYPCVHMGDSGDFHSFFYVKGSKSFETLRLAFIDPESRIKSEEEFKEIKNSRNFIESLRIKQHKTMSETELFFSPHLNVVIGGRSSGKSLFFHVIGAKTDAINTGKESTYKDVIEMSNVKIKSRLDQDYKDTTTIGQSYVYINQGDVVNYFEQKKLESLALKSGKGEEYKQALTRFKEYSVKLKNTIDTLVSAYKLCQEYGSRQFVLHDTTIKHILSKKHMLTLDDQLLMTKYDVKDGLTSSVQTMKEGIANLSLLLEDPNVKFSEKETQTVIEVIEMLDVKLKVLESEISLSLERIRIIENVKSIILQVNEEQSEESKAKQQAISLREALVADVAIKFELFNSLSKAALAVEGFDYNISERVPLSDDVTLALEVPKNDDINEEILEGINNAKADENLYINLVMLLANKSTIKNYKTNTASDLHKKIQNQINHIYIRFEKPEDFLEYSDNENSKNKSPGYNSEKYLEIILQNPKIDKVFIDQPEDNLGNRFIAETLVKIIRHIKFKKQIFLVTHNPSVVVFGDAESIVIAENIENIISYRQIVLEDKSAQKEICQILDGGEYVFHKRALKYNIQRILKEGSANA